MEFGEKLCALRKHKGYTQEELAQALYVSRTAISKWESGRGYPSIDSLKEIASFFSVSIDELLSGETLVLIAEKENKANLKRMCSLMFGICDLLYLALLVLPLYSYPAEGHVYAVNLLEKMSCHQLACEILFLTVMACGAAKVLLTSLKIGRGQKALTFASMLLGVLAVLILAGTRESYAVGAAFLLFTLKGLLLFLTH